MLNATHQKVSIYKKTSSLRPFSTQLWVKLLKAQVSIQEGKNITKTFQVPLKEVRVFNTVF